MYLPFEEMPDHARVWVYQSDRELSKEEAENLEHQAIQFVSAWTAHGAGLMSSARVFHQRFLVLSVDEQHASASGCSIDSSVRYIKSAEQTFGINFFDRTLVAFLQADGISIQPINRLKELATQGVIGPENITFNNLVETMGELRKSWKVKVAESWLARYF